MLKAVASIAKQVLTESKTVAAQKNVPESEKAISKGSVTEVKTDDITETRLLMLAKAYKNTMDNKSNVQTKEGPSQTVIKGKPVFTTQNTLLAVNKGQKEIKTGNLLLKTASTDNEKLFGKKGLKDSALENAIAKLAFVHEGGVGGKKWEPTIVTVKQLEDFGWINPTQELADEINESMSMFGINTGKHAKEQVIAFMATTGHEAGMGGYDYIQSGSSDKYRGSWCYSIDRRV